MGFLNSKVLENLQQVLRQQRNNLVISTANPGQDVTKNLFNLLCTIMNLKPA